MPVLFPPLNTPTRGLVPPGDSVPYVPDLTRTSSTDPALPPHCSSATPRRKPPGATFLWTLALGWTFDEESIAAVTLPPPFVRDRGDILAAVGGHGPAYRRASDLQEEVQASINVRVGQDRLPILENASAVVKRMEVAAAEGSCRVKVLLHVEAPRSLAPELLDLIEADVDVRVVTNEELPFDGDDASDTVVDTDTNTDEPVQQTLVDNPAPNTPKPPARKRQEISGVEDLVDELPVEA